MTIKTLKSFAAASAVALAANAIVANAGALAASPPANLAEEVAKDYNYVRTLYEHFHANPELSFKERETSARLAEELRSIGFAVSTNVGREWVRAKATADAGAVLDGVDGYGVVAVMENGEGPTLMVRADMDALPLQERTGLAYASKAVMADYLGQEAPVMHACAHDSHMAVLIGAARRLVAMKDQWSGTLILIGQPAEELGLGATAMLEDGLYKKWPKPDSVLSMHTSGWDPAGAIYYTPGYALANVDSVDIFIRGIGTHGSAPHTGKDPIVVGAHIVTALQTLVARETNPLASGVVTVGAFQAGYKHNIIPDEAHLQLTVRSYEDDVRRDLLEGIERIAIAQAASAGLTGDLAPTVEFEQDAIPSTYNDLALTKRVVSAMSQALGEDRVRERVPSMGGEDFSQFSRTEEKIPTFMFWVGSLDPVAYERSIGRLALPGNHSPLYAPLAEPTLKLGVEAMTVGALELLGS